MYREKICGGDGQRFVVVVDVCHRCQGFENFSCNSIISSRYFAAAYLHPENHSITIFCVLSFSPSIRRKT